MSLSTHYLEYGLHVARLHRRRRRAYAPKSNTAAQYMGFGILYGHGAPLGGPSGRRSSAMIRSMLCIVWLVRLS